MSGSASPPGVVVEAGPLLLVPLLLLLVVAAVMDDDAGVDVDWCTGLVLVLVDTSSPPIDAALPLAAAAAGLEPPPAAPGSMASVLRCTPIVAAAFSVDSTVGLLPTKPKAELWAALWLRGAVLPPPLEPPVVVMTRLLEYAAEGWGSCGRDRSSVEGILPHVFCMMMPCR